MTVVEILRGNMGNSVYTLGYIVYFSDDAISAQNLLNILLASTNIYGNSFNQNPFPNQFGLGQSQNQASSTTDLLSSLSGIFRSSPTVVHNLKLSSELARGGLQSQNYRRSFKVGKQHLRKDKTLYKYVRRISNPFNDKGQVIVKKGAVKKQIRKGNRKIPCNKLAKKNKKALEICKSVKKKKKSVHKRKNGADKKLKKPKETNGSQGFVQKLRHNNPFKMSNFWNLIG